MEEEEREREKGVKKEEREGCREREREKRVRKSGKEEGGGDRGRKK